VAVFKDNQTQTNVKKKEMCNILLQYETSVRELYVDRTHFSERIAVFLLEGGGGVGNSKLRAIMRDVENV
jgi:hypothetical protein